MIHARLHHSVGDAYVWALDHLRHRFGPAGWPIAQAAARLVMERRTPGYAASGQLADLHCRGLVTAAGHPTRCLYVERMAHGVVGRPTRSPAWTPTAACPP